MIFNENNKDKSEEKSNEFSFIKKKDISQSNEKEILIFIKTFQRKKINWKKKEIK